MLARSILVAVAGLGFGACAGSDPVEAPTVASTSVAAPLRPDAGAPNFVGDLEVTVLGTALLDPEAVGTELPDGFKFLRVELGLRNPTANVLQVPEFTLSCEGSVVGGRVEHASPDSLTASSVESRQNAFGSVLFKVPGACHDGLLLARPVSAAGMRPPPPVAIKIN